MFVHDDLRVLIVLLVFVEMTALEALCSISLQIALPCFKSGWVPAMRNQTPRCPGAAWVHGRQLRTTGFKGKGKNAVPVRRFDKLRLDGQDRHQHTRHRDGLMRMHCTI